MLYSYYSALINWEHDKQMYTQVSYNRQDPHERHIKRLNALSTELSGVGTPPLFLIPYPTTPLKISHKT